VPDISLLARPLESAHFGLPVFSSTVANRDDAERVLGLAAGIPHGLLIVRTPAAAIGAIQTLERHGAVLCDVLQTLHIAVPAARRASHATFTTTLRAGTPADADRLAWIGGEAFRGHTGHWHADDRLPTNLADLLYARWSADLARGSDDAEHPVLIAERGSGPAGFLALARVDETAWTVTLTGVAPNHRGAGVFRALLDAAVDTVAERGGRRLDYETQITNHSALRAVSRAGFEPASARLTFHIWMSGA
jgi:ribosomal protein S18 acetylase RimI-like enzyme